MSHLIEQGKRCVALFTDDPRLDGLPGRRGTVLAYLHAVASNNVRPRRFDWRLLAVERFGHWNGQVMLPETIWRLGHEADGGLVQPRGRPVSGLGYVREWKRAAERPLPAAHASARLGLEVRLWLGSGDVGRERRAEHERLLHARPEFCVDFAARDAGGREPELHAAYQRLFGEGAVDRGDEIAATTSTGRDRLADALFLFRHRDVLRGPLDWVAPAGDALLDAALEVPPVVPVDPLSGPLRRSDAA